ncbi:hypothetical protein SRHO_G00005970 [Serrasalmus rhombeus]
MDLAWTHCVKRFLKLKLNKKLVLLKISAFTIFTLQNIPDKGENAPNVLLDREKKLQNLDFEVVLPTRSVTKLTSSGFARQ